MEFLQKLSSAHGQKEFAHISGADVHDDIGANRLICLFLSKKVEGKEREAWGAGWRLTCKHQWEGRSFYSLKMNGGKKTRPHLYHFVFIPRHVGKMNMQRRANRQTIKCLASTLPASLFSGLLSTSPQRINTTRGASAALGKRMVGGDLLLSSSLSPPLRR